MIHFIIFGFAYIKTIISFFLNVIYELFCFLTCSMKKPRGVISPGVSFLLRPCRFYEVLFCFFLLIDTDSFDDRVSVFVFGNDIDTETF